MDENGPLLVLRREGNKLCCLSVFLLSFGRSGPERKPMKDYYFGHSREEEVCFIPDSLNGLTRHFLTPGNLPV